jgi:MoxR-like ATPase
MLYPPRLLAVRPDVEVLRDLRAAGKPVLLYGPPGTGKTSLIEAAYPDLVTVAGDGETTTGDLVGEYTQRPDGTFAWVDGPLVTAMSEGRCFFIDDCTLISPAVLATVYPAMDGRGEIVLTAHESETIEAEPGFYVAGGHNPGVAGAILTEALASRFAAHIEVTTDFDLAGSRLFDLRVHPRQQLRQVLRVAGRRQGRQRPHRRRHPRLFSTESQRRGAAKAMAQ